MKPNFAACIAGLFFIGLTVAEENSVEFESIHGLVLNAKLVSAKNPRQIAIEIALKNETERPIPIVIPGDGSGVGWREPHVYYNRRIPGKIRRLDRCSLPGNRTMWTLRFELGQRRRNPPTRSRKTDLNLGSRSVEPLQIRKIRRLPFSSGLRLHRQPLTRSYPSPRSIHSQSNERNQTVSSHFESRRSRNRHRNVELDLLGSTYGEQIPNGFRPAIVEIGR